MSEGLYHCRCHACEEMFRGPKRAITCPSCERLPSVRVQARQASRAAMVSFLVDASPCAIILIATLIYWWRQG